MPSSAGQNRIVIIRPGALGDVLAVRGALAWAKRRFPSFELVLLAPGARGRLLVAPGFADRACDWDGAAFAWLFGDGAAPPSPALAAAFAGARIVAAFVNFPDGAGGETETFSARLREAAGGGEAYVFPAAPKAEERENIAAWLLAKVRGAAERTFPGRGCCGDDDGGGDVVSAAIQRRIPVAPAGAELRLPRRYAVLHPGSGGARKNWPLANFTYLAARLLSGGLEVVVTAGPADGRLGADLCAALPAARLVSNPSLPELAGVLAGADLYVGNDSGVSHLAAAVAGPDGRFPAVFVVFGPTDSAVWAPSGSIVLAAGRNFSLLDGAAAWPALRSAARGLV